LTIFSPGRDDINIVHPFSVGDIDANAVQTAQLICAVAQGIQPELAIQGQVLEWLGERIQPKAATDCRIIVSSLACIELCEIAADGHFFHYLWRQRV
jgi:hypothetical protein